MFGDFYLRFAKNLLEMADAKRCFCQQIQNAKPRPIAEALVNLNQVHSSDLAAGLHPTTSRGRFVFCSFARETLSAFVRKDQIEMLAVLLRLEDWILSYDTTIVFHFDIQTIVRQDSITQL